MKIIITESQYTKAYQNIVDMVLENLKSTCLDILDSDFYDDSETDCQNLWVIEDIEVATAYEKEIGLIFYVNTNYVYDMGGPFYDIKLAVEEITGTKDIKLKLLNVINKKDRDWS